MEGNGEETRTESREKKEEREKGKIQRKESTERGKKKTMEGRGKNGEKGKQSTHPKPDFGILALVIG